MENIPETSSQKDFYLLNKDCVNDQSDMECSLFMDETSADLDNYLSISLPDYLSSPGVNDASSNDQDFESTTMNSLSKNIKGKYQKNVRALRKNNKFFKGKILDEKSSTTPNEIPVINEAMKKMFKPLTESPDKKYAPKMLVKTYYNKNKNKSTSMSESFALPDDPVVPKCDLTASEQDSIDLDHGNENYNNLLLDNPWSVPVNLPELEFDEDFPRNAFKNSNASTILNLEEEERVESNSANNTQGEPAHKQSESLTKSIVEGPLEPKIILQPLNLDDCHVFETFNLSPIKNKKNLLFQRLKDYSRKNIPPRLVSVDFVASNRVENEIKKNHIDIKNEEKMTVHDTLHVNTANCRRNTRLNNSSNNTQISLIKTRSNRNNRTEQNCLDTSTNPSHRISQKQKIANSKTVSSNSFIRNDFEIDAKNKESIINFSPSKETILLNSKELTIPNSDDNSAEHLLGSSYSDVDNKSCSVSEFENMDQNGHALRTEKRQNIHTIVGNESIVTNQKSLIQQKKKDGIYKTEKNESMRFKINEITKTTEENKDNPPANLSSMSSKLPNLRNNFKCNIDEKVKSKYSETTEGVEDLTDKLPEAKFKVRNVTEKQHIQIRRSTRKTTIESSSVHSPKKDTDDNVAKILESPSPENNEKKSPNPHANFRKGKKQYAFSVLYSPPNKETNEKGINRRSKKLPQANSKELSNAVEKLENKHNIDNILTRETRSTKSKNIQECGLNVIDGLRNMKSSKKVETVNVSSSQKTPEKYVPTSSSAMPNSESILTPEYSIAKQDNFIKSRITKSCPPRLYTKKLRKYSNLRQKKVKYQNTSQTESLEKATVINENINGKSFDSYPTKINEVFLEANPMKKCSNSPEHTPVNNILLRKSGRLKQKPNKISGQNLDNQNGLLKDVKISELLNEKSDEISINQAFPGDSVDEKLDKDLSAEGENILNENIATKNKAPKYTKDSSKDTILNCAEDHLKINDLPLEGKEEKMVQQNSNASFRRSFRLNPRKVTNGESLTTEFQDSHEFVSNKQTTNSQSSSNKDEDVIISTAHKNRNELVLPVIETNDCDILHRNYNYKSTRKSQRLKSKGDSILENSDKPSTDTIEEVNLNPLVPPHNVDEIKIASDKNSHENNTSTDIETKTYLEKFDGVLATQNADIKKLVSRKLSETDKIQYVNNAVSGGISSKNTLSDLERVKHVQDKEQNFAANIFQECSGDVSYGKDNSISARRSARFKSKTDVTNIITNSHKLPVLKVLDSSSGSFNNINNMGKLHWVNSNLQKTASSCIIEVDTDNENISTNETFKVEQKTEGSVNNCITNNFEANCIVFSEKTDEQKTKFDTKNIDESYTKADIGKHSPQSESSLTETNKTKTAKLEYLFDNLHEFELGQADLGEKADEKLDSHIEDKIKNKFNTNNEYNQTDVDEKNDSNVSSSNFNEDKTEVSKKCYDLQGLSVHSTPSITNKVDVSEKKIKNTEETSKPNTIIDDYFDVGYDIHRRTSFRKILERVMELSRIEMEENIKIASRMKRCKSVPHDQFYGAKRDILPKNASDDKKFAYSDVKKKTITKFDPLKAKRVLDFSKKSNVSVIKPLKRIRTKSFNIPKREQSVRIQDRQRKKRAKSVTNLSDQNMPSEDENTEFMSNALSNLQQIKMTTKEKVFNDVGIKIVEYEKSNGNEMGNNFRSISSTKLINDENSVTLTTAVVTNNSLLRSHNNISALNRGGGCSTNDITKVPSKVIVKDANKSDNCFASKVQQNSNGNCLPVMNRTNMYLEDNNWNALQTSTPLTIKKRSRSHSESAVDNDYVSENDTILKRSKSVLGRPRKLSKRDHRRLKRKVQQDDIEAKLSVHSKAAKKVLYEFKVGDLLWGKIGNYPYWPCLVVLDPATSQFKKYKLLRTTPYYHVRFFGDNGKRAWTIHVNPYEGPDDLEKLADQFWTEGVQSNYIKECCTIKPTQKLNWNNAVIEAEMVKYLTVEERLKFFEKILVSEKGAAFSKDSKNFKSCDNSDTNFEKKKNAVISIEQNVNNVEQCLPQKTKNSIKEDSVLACIDSVIAKYCSSEYNGTLSQDLVQEGIKHTVSNRETRKRDKSVPRKTLNQSANSDLGVELLLIPPVSESSQSPTSITNENSSTRRSKIKTKGAGMNDLITSINLLSNEIVAVPSPKTLRCQSKSLSQVDNLVVRKYSPRGIRTNEENIHSQNDFVSMTSKLRKKKQNPQADQSDSESKASDNSLLFSNISEPSKAEKNIFRGVTKEKVCQICEKLSNVVKCKGVCNGDFHMECIEKSFKLSEQHNKYKEDDSLKVENISSDQVEISSVGSKKELLIDITLSPVNKKMSILEQFDKKMKELMTQVESQNSFIESTDSSSEEFSCHDDSCKPQKSKGMFKHVTADDVSIIRVIENGNIKPKSLQRESSTVDESVYKCPYCISTLSPACFVCQSFVSPKGNSVRQRCSVQKCGRFYHLECLNIWHQTQWSFVLHEKRKSEAVDNFVCPRHVCHTCASENMGCSIGTCPSDKLVKCLKCPSTYHNSYHCVPAGSQLLTFTQIICPRHIQTKLRKPLTCNTIWCFVCSEGGNLICCETCPTSVHAECLPVNLMEDDSYICEDCESGRFPLYGEVVWVKCGTFRWWPAIILFPSEVPSNVELKPHAKGDFVVKFFGTYDYYWVGRGRTFLYQEGDTGCLNSYKNRIDEAFSRALKEAAEVYQIKQESKSKRAKEVNNGLKPPPYVRIKINRPVGNVRIFEGNSSNTTSCDCNPKDRNPCGPNSNCLNRLLLTECNPDICPAGQRCKNQCFERREYPQMIPYRTVSRGWGLKTLEDLIKGQFVIEYVGELIDDEEYQRRIKKMHEQKDENYYFLTIDKDRMLDAGPKGNVARFMNHSCQPNCETQKWTVNGDTRVGLFAIEDIPANTELTFNYNLECIGTEKKVCRCGAANCSGFIGVKPDEQKSVRKNSTTKKKDPENGLVIYSDSCFTCGKSGNVKQCIHKSCFKSYHLKCVQLKRWPEGRWICPSHNCNICSKRTARRCRQCTNSYCPSHSKGNIRHDDILGFVCTRHDPTKRKRGRPTKSIAEESLVEDTKSKPTTFQSDKHTNNRHSSKRMKLL